MTFWVPGRPVGKERPRMTRFGHVYTPKKTADYEFLIGQLYRVAARKLSHGSPPWIGLVIRHRGKVHPDGDNVVKCYLDAIAKERGENDREYTGGWVFQPTTGEPGVVCTIV